MKSFVNSMGLGGLYKNKSILNFRTIDDNFSLFRVLNFRMSCRGGRFLNFRTPEGKLLYVLYSKL